MMYSQSNVNSKDISGSYYYCLKCYSEYYNKSASIFYNFILLCYRYYNTINSLIEEAKYISNNK